MEQEQDATKMKQNNKLLLEIKHIVIDILKIFRILEE